MPLPTNKRIATYRQKLGRVLAQREATVKMIEKEKDVLLDAKRDMKAYAEVQKIVQALAQTLQQKAHQRIASVVTRCLQVVFEDPYEFRIQFDRKRGKTEAALQFARDGHVLEDPTNEAGGGPIDVAAFALRLICMTLTKPKLRRVLVLDEPFRNPSVEYRGRIREMLKLLAKEMGVQIIMVTHIPELRDGKVIEL